VNRLASFVEKLKNAFDKRQRERKSTRQKRYANRCAPHSHDQPGGQTKGHGEYGGGASGASPSLSVWGEALRAIFRTRRLLAAEATTLPETPERRLNSRL
jgi:hypothetical protein